MPWWRDSMRRLQQIDWTDERLCAVVAALICAVVGVIVGSW